MAIHGVDSERVRMRGPDIEVTSRHRGQEILVSAVQYVDTSLPAIIYTTDGSNWSPAAEEAHLFDYGTSNRPQTACWTGDRFLIGFEYSNYGKSLLIESFDGVHWAFQPLIPFFDPDQGVSYVDRLVAGGTGLVVALTDEQAVISKDFGATWAIAPVIDDFSGYFVNAHGSTIVWIYGDYCLSSNDQGDTWTEFTHPGELGGVNWIEYVNGAWWFAYGGNGDRDPAGLIYKTNDFQNYERVLNPWDNDWPSAVAYFEGSSVQAGYIARLVVADDGSVMALGESSDAFPTGKILGSPDGGATWKAIVDTDQASNYADTAIRADILPVLSTVEYDTFFDLGATFAFGRWWIANDETVSGNAPVMLSGSRDFTEWKYPRLNREIMGDSNHFSYGFNPLVAATV